MALGNDVQVAINIDFQDVQIPLRNLELLGNYLAGQRAKVINVDGFCIFFTEDLLDSMRK